MKKLLKNLLRLDVSDLGSEIRALDIIKHCDTKYTYINKCLNVCIGLGVLEHRKGKKYQWRKDTYGMHKSWVGVYIIVRLSQNQLSELGYLSNSVARNLWIGEKHISKLSEELNVNHRRLYEVILIMHGLKMVKLKNRLYSVDESRIMAPPPLLPGRKQLTPTRKSKRLNTAWEHLTQLKLDFTKDVF